MSYLFPYLREDDLLEIFRRSRENPTTFHAQHSTFGSSKEGFLRIARLSLIITTHDRSLIAFLAPTPHGTLTVHPLIFSHRALHHLQDPSTLSILLALSNRYLALEVVVPPGGPQERLVRRMGFRPYGYHIDYFSDKDYTIPGIRYLLLFDELIERIHTPRQGG